MTYKASISESSIVTNELSDLTISFYLEVKSGARLRVVTFYTIGPYVLAFEESCCK